MSEDICFLITLTDNNVLYKVALRAKRDLFFGDCLDRPMLSDNREFLFHMLPMHVQDLGKIVDIEEIFEVEIKDEE